MYDRIDFKTNTVRDDKGGHYIMMKGIIHQFSKTQHWYSAIFYVIDILSFIEIMFLVHNCIEYIACMCL
jgi:hypothetical protein